MRKNPDKKTAPAGAQAGGAIKKTGRRKSYVDSGEVFIRDPFSPSYDGEK